MKSKLKFHGDFADFDCPKCFHTNSVCVKDETLRFYSCSYCGEKIEVKNEKKDFVEVTYEVDNDYLRHPKRNESLYIEQYQNDCPLGEFIGLLDSGDKVKIRLELVKK